MIDILRSAVRTRSNAHELTNLDIVATAEMLYKRSVKQNGDFDVIFSEISGCEIGKLPHKEMTRAAMKAYLKSHGALSGLLFFNFD